MTINYNYDKNTLQKVSNMRRNVTIKNEVNKYECVFLKIIMI